MGEGRGRTTVALGIAVVLVATYLLALRSMWLDAAAQDLEWARRSQLLNGLEALAFAAAGALLGTTVQRAATEEVRKDAERERERADENEAEARSAAAMRGVMTAKRDAPPDRFAGAQIEDASAELLRAQLDEILAAGDAARQR